MITLAILFLIAAVVRLLWMLATHDPRPDEAYAPPLLDKPVQEAKANSVRAPFDYSSASRKPEPGEAKPGFDYNSASRKPDAGPNPSATTG